MGKVNWKKIILFATVSAFAPALGSWAQAVGAGHDLPFTLGNIVVPAVPALITTLAALFSNPRHS